MTSDRSLENSGLILRQTRWYEGQRKDGGDLPKVDVYSHGHNGGWASVDQMKKDRFARFKANTPTLSVTETEFGFRTEEECRGAFAGLTRVEVVELVGATS